MKKKIIIINNNLYTGGVQKALVNFINAINENYEITLFLFNKEGQYLDLVPKNVKVVEGKGLTRLLGMSQEESKKLGIQYYMIRGILSAISKVFSNRMPLKILYNGECIKEKYDYGISYLHSHHEKMLYGGCNEFLLDKVNASEKITFVHCDFLNHGGNTEHNKNIYNQFDKIIAVSHGCMNNFISAISNLKEKTYYLYNFNDNFEIKKLSEINPIKYDENYINIITVARISEEKGLIRCVPIIKKLVDEGKKVKWHIIGDGPLINQLKKIILENNLENNILLYGNQKNPYRYMKNADLFFLPSYHEAAPMVFDEAKTLRIPILATQTTSTQEMIIDCNAGWVCNNQVTDIEKKLKYLVNNKDEITNIKEKMQIAMSDDEKLEKLKNILES